METQKDTEATESSVARPVLKKINVNMSEEELTRKKRERQATIKAKRQQDGRSAVRRKLQFIEHEMMQGRGYNINNPVEKEELEQLGIYKEAYQLVVELMAKAQFEKELRSAFGEDDEDMFISY